MTSQFKKRLFMGVISITAIILGSLALLIQVSRLDSLLFPLHHEYIRQVTVWRYKPQQQTALLFIPRQGTDSAEYKDILWNLAHQGYVIVSVDPTCDSTLSEEEQLAHWTQAATAVLDAAHGIEGLCHFPIKDWIVIGHALGGSTALRLCRTDSRCIAGITMDGGLDYGKDPCRGFDKPFLFLLKDPEFEDPSPERLMIWQMTAAAYRSTIEAFLTNIKQFCHNMGGYCSIITIAGSGHNSFEDISFSLGTKLYAAQKGYDIGSADPYKLLPAINAYMNRFLQQVKETTHAMHRINKPQ